MCTNSQVVAIVVCGGLSFGKDVAVGNQVQPDITDRPFLTSYLGRRAPCVTIQGVGAELYTKPNHVPDL